jgi:hydroxyacylglutathione hydrolase
MNLMNLIALPAFTDNYIWMLHNGKQAVVVDPGESAQVVAALDTHQLTLAAILVTHRHADHVDGIDALRPRLKGHVYGPLHPRIPKPYIPVAEGDSVEALDMRFEVMHLPGHTLEHVAYYLPAASLQAPASAEVGAQSESAILFSGDTLLVAWKASLSKCTTHFNAWLSCRVKHRCVAHMSTPYLTCASHKR